MKKPPKVLTRMRLSCCWGDNLNVKELNDVVDYINELEYYKETLRDMVLELQEENKKQKEVIDKAIEYIKEKARNNCWIDQYESCDLIKILKEVE